MSDETPAPRPLEPTPAEPTPAGPTPAGPTSGGPSSGGPPPLPPPERRWDLLTQAALLVMVVTLLSFGRTWWCKCGGLSPWTGDALSQHTSQHLLDPYSLTHVLHGVGFYALLWLTLGGRAGPRLRWALALCVEAGWEVLENTNWVIERYRAGTI